MIEWNLKDICKTKLSEKDGSSILGYCIIKTRFFSIILEKKSASMKFLDKVDNLKSWYKENKKAKIWRVSNTLKNLFTFWDIRTRDMWKVCLQTFRNN